MPRNFETTVTIYLLVAVFGLGVSVLAVFGQAAGAGGFPALEARRGLPGYFLALSPMEDPEAFGGFLKAGTLPKKLNRAMPAGAVTLLALPGEAVPFQDSRRGFRLLLANTTGETVSFPAEDSRLPILRQALNAAGEWQPIEYRWPASWCGNSYHRVFLPSGHTWSFNAPEYAGPLRTRMRFVLDGKGPGQPLYSNEFEGSIHPDQFASAKGSGPNR